MRRNLEPGTRKPPRRPASKQRMMVCWETLQISAASPVVKTSFKGMHPADSPLEEEFGRGTRGHIYQHSRRTPFRHLPLWERLGEAYPSSHVYSNIPSYHRPRGV